MQVMANEREVEKFRDYLVMEERSENTVRKYTHDLRNFIDFAGHGEELSKELVMRYKQELGQRYKASSANSMLAAVNSYLAYKGRREFCVRQFKVQQNMLDSKALTSAEYKRLVAAALEQDNMRLAMILETICSTGIRISELSFITKEAVELGQVQISNKGKIRTVFLIRKLRRKLLKYGKSSHVMTGPLFVTGSGNPGDRSNVWAEMKRLCKAAQVDAAKVYPHNLRNLYACTYYGIEKGLVHQAELLGHSSVETTRIYTRNTAREEEKKLERM